MKPHLVDEILCSNFLFETHQAGHHFGTILNLFFHSVKTHYCTTFSFA